VQFRKPFNLLETRSPPGSRLIVEVGSLLQVRLSWVTSSVLVVDKVLVCFGGGRGVMEAFTGYEDFVNISSTLRRNVPEYILDSSSRKRDGMHHKVIRSFIVEDSRAPGFFKSVFHRQLVEFHLP
jgi:hypothetical protein